MLNLDIVNPDEIAKSDFDALAEIKGYEVFSKEKVSGFARLGKDLISKAETEELSKEDSDQLELVKSEIGTLKRVTVINDDLSKETVYYREAKKEKSE